MSKLLSKFTNHRRQTFYCHYCLHRFSGVNAERNHGNHESECSVHDPQRIKLPFKEPILKCTKIEWKQRVPFVIYADFESILNRINTCLPDSKLSATTKLQEHVACGFSYVVVGPNGPHPPVNYRGLDAVEVFLESLKLEEEVTKAELKGNIPMDLSSGEFEESQHCTKCYICDEDFTVDDNAVRDHCHYSGQFRGMAHNSCNLKLRVVHFIPVIMHNLSKYDAHLIMQRIGLQKERKLSCIPSTVENYISFSFGMLRFIDSFRFLPDSLESLVANIVEKGSDQFRVLNQFYLPEQIELLLRKQAYPYEYMNSFERFDETCLPSKDAFYSSLTGENITDEKYNNAVEVWRRFNIQTLGDFHDLYVTVDSLQLADVFENFRSTCMTDYGLDPAHAFTSPGFAWQAALHMTKVEMDLFLDPYMHLFIEKGIRGGVSMISHRFARANNPYIPETYDAAKPNNYIMYLDVNNLYGLAMSLPLPVSGFEWVSHPNLLMYTLQQILNCPDDSLNGYILEVDLEYPEQIHDLNNEYPLAPEAIKITEHMFSSYYVQMMETLGVPVTDTLPKLTPNLYDRENYEVHFRNLKFYLSRGMKLISVKRVLRFTQKPWLKPYIDFNTEKRKTATDEFSKNLYKLLNNNVFGKTMENLRNQINFDLVNSPEMVVKKASSPTFKKFTIFHNELVGVERVKKCLNLVRPIFTGFSILELSKITMYEFHYDYIMSKYGGRARLLFTDTDSLTYDIETEDVYKDFEKDSDRFDFSGYPTNHFLYNEKNKKSVGKNERRVGWDPDTGICWFTSQSI